MRIRYAESESDSLANGNTPLPSKPSGGEPARAEVQGLDISCTDGPELPPELTNLAADEVEAWFLAHPSGTAPAIRLLVIDTTAEVKSPPQLSLFALPFSEKLLEHAIWNKEPYVNLIASRGGGCAALLDQPWCFMLQTPLDGGPFCTLCLSRRGNVVKGIYAYRASHAEDRYTLLFDPMQIVKDELILSGWRGSGMQIITLPQAVAKAHARYISSEFDEILGLMTVVETELSTHAVSTTDNFSHCSQKLQRCAGRLMALERRARFQAQILTAIESITGATRDGKVPWPPLAPLRSQLETWAYDFESLPHRIELARNTINSLVQQRNQQLNLEIAESSRRMTEAALRDNATMKTIAIMTMIFLPSTAVASFFSMSMFDWSAESGSQLSSKWLWIFFVIAVPLTAMVLIIWYVWAKRYERLVGTHF